MNENVQYFLGMSVYLMCYPEYYSPVVAYKMKKEDTTGAVCSCVSLIAFICARSTLAKHLNKTHVFFFSKDQHLCCMYYYEEKKIDKKI